MEGYLGEEVVAIQDTPFANYSKEDWAMYYIGRYGQIDGDHHKLWVLDQVARIMNGATHTIKLAKWDNGHTEWREEMNEPPIEYYRWVAEMKDGEDGPNTYGYDEGCPP